jgi:ketosteroid isomerase-like protein
MKSILGLGLALLAVSIPVRAQGTRSPILDQLMAEFVLVYNNKDAVKLAAFYANDASAISPGLVTIRGRGDIEATFKQQFERGGGVLELTPLESEIANNLAFGTGTFKETSREDPSKSADGKFLFVFRQVDNEWKIAYDMQVF